MNQKKTEIEIPKRFRVFRDDRTGYMSMAIPFAFPDGHNAIMTITQLSKDKFVPEDLIDSISINYKENEIQKR